MSKTKFKQFTDNVRTTLNQHSPEILTGIGIAGMVTTTILAVKATPKALTLLEEAKREIDCDEKLPVKTVIKSCWKCYISAAVTGTMSIACLIGASSVNAKRNAALAAAYTLSESALKDYKDKVIEVVGEKKEKEIQDSVAKDRLEKKPVSKSEVIVTNHGETLCYDYQTDRYFKSDIDKIKRAVNEINRKMLCSFDMCISLNELYDELGLERVPFGNELGWSVDKGLVEPVFSSQLADDGTPCLVIDYNIVPRRGYYKAV